MGAVWIFIVLVVTAIGCAIANTVGVGPVALWCGVAVVASVATIAAMVLAALGGALADTVLMIAFDDEGAAPPDLVDLDAEET